MDPTVIPIVGMAIPITLVPIILGLKHARYTRELEHAERMKALELGRVLPQDESWWTAPRLGAFIAVGVPIGVWFCAMMAAESANGSDQFWVPPTLVSMVAVISGTILAGTHFARRAKAEAPSH